MFETSIFILTNLFRNESNFIYSDLIQRNHDFVAIELDFMACSCSVIFLT